MTPGSGVGNTRGFLVCLAGLAVCEDPSQECIAAADLTPGCLAPDEAVVRRYTAQTIRVRGFVDHANQFLSVYMYRS